MRSSFDIIITANSPGEVAGWVRPAVQHLRDLPGNPNITVFILPCTFASGSESAVAGQIPGVNLVIGPQASAAYLYLHRRPPGFAPGNHGVVLFLGGDPAYAVILAKKLRYPAVCYTEREVNWHRSFSYFAVPYETTKSKLMAKGVSPARISVIGNLMVDAVEPVADREEVRRRLGVASDRLVLLMPGSRPAEIQYLASFLLKTADQIVARCPNVHFAMSISPFVPDSLLRKALAILPSLPSGNAPDDSTGNDATPWGDPVVLPTPAERLIPAWRGRQYDLMAASDLALTIPGTNTMELAFLGIPMLVLLPLHRPEDIPLTGVFGLVGRIPYLGRMIKRFLIPKILRRLVYTAWPNRLAGREIVPELRGTITPEEAASVAAHLLGADGSLPATKEALLGLAGNKGAGKRLAVLIQEVLEEHYGRN